jgi:SPP1 family predicted phage head-tail adaptor
MIQSGKLTKRVTFQYQAKVPDGMGGFTETWTDVPNSTVWAGIWTTKASEMITPEASTMNITHRIRIRYRSGIKHDWRIKFGTRYFAIIQGPFNYEEKNEKLDFYCREVS